MGNIKMNWRGVEEVATSSEMAGAIEGAAELVESAVRAQGERVGAFGSGGEIPLPVKVYGPENTHNMRTDRAKAYVTLAHPAGLAVQAKRGVLTRAAAAVGLQVKGGG